ncbi:hypothetical protein C2U69_35690 [Cupriavidus pinatubonensis]|nr:hypothetical protein C2U69_35690 [Cupriavidus pinatubonensis]
MPVPEFCRVARFEDPDDHARELPQFDQQYCQTGPGRFTGEVHFFPESGGVHLCREQINVPLVQKGIMHTGKRLFGVPCSLGQDMTYQGAAGSNSIGQLAGGAAFELHNGGPVDYLMVSVDDEAFAGYAEYLGGLESVGWLSQSNLRVTPALLSRTVGELDCALRIAGGNASLFRYENARKALCEDVIGSLLCLLTDATPPARRDLTRMTYADVVRRSREYVEAHPGEAFSVMDLCRLLRVSRRTLQNSFLEVSGVPSSTYLRAVRLARVRKLLRETPASELNTGDAAARWGFLHASKFAVCFRTMYGILPSQVPRP